MLATIPAAIIQFHALPKACKIREKHADLIPRDS